MQAQAQDKFKAVTTFTVIADMARNVAGDAAVVESITKAGAEIHGYQPTPRDIIKAQNADLILWNGLNLELWFEQFFSNLRDVPSATLSKEQIREAIKPLRDAILAIPVEKRWLVSCEGAFSYLTRDFEMQELYLWPINADQQGTPQQVRKVIDSVREEGIEAVFCESTVSQDPAKQVARETGATYEGVLYVDSLTEADGPVPTYIDLLRVTSQTLLDGLTK